jgi:hypothetical protein
MDLSFIVGSLLNHYLLVDRTTNADELEYILNKIAESETESKTKARIHKEELRLWKFTCPSLCILTGPI